MHADFYNASQLTTHQGFRGECREGELNPQGAKHRRILSPLRLPVPPSRLSKNYSLAFDFTAKFEAAASG